MTTSLREQIAVVRGAQMTRRHHAQFDDGLSLGANKAADALGDVVTTLENHAGLQRTFDLRWAADQRAIRKWQDAHPGNDLVWPDRCDMVMWLLEQHDALAKAAREAAVVLSDFEADDEDRMGVRGRVLAALGNQP